jgi:hypothetical protein
VQAGKEKRLPWSIAAKKAFLEKKKAKNAEDMKRLKSPKNVMEGTGVIEHHCKRRR